MKAHGRILVAVVALLALAVVLWAVSPPAEPKCGGKRLSHWLKCVDCDGVPELHFGAREAVRQIGTEAIPFLLADLQTYDTPLLDALEEVAEWLGFRLELPSASLRRFRALAGFHALGRIAEPATSELGKLMFGTNAAVARCAQYALGSVGGQTVVPILMCGLTNATLNAESASQLGNLQSQAKIAVPALVTNLGAGAAHTRIRAAAALGDIALQPELVVPALARQVSDPNRVARLSAISALAAFGQEAASAMPALQVAGEDFDQEVSTRARWALHHVQCERRLGAIVRGPRLEKKIALAFTGHMYAEGGETILYELARHRTRASFFFTGTFLANGNFEPLIRLIINDRHLLGPHSDEHLLYCAWDSDRRTLVTYGQFSSDLEANRAKIQKAVNRLIDRKLLRLPPIEVQEKSWKRYTLKEMPWIEVNGNKFYPVRYFLPPYEHYNREIADWATKHGMTLINYTPGTRSNADYTGEADTNFVSSQAILDSILKKERQDPHGLNGFILLFHIGAGPGRADKFHTRFGELLDVLAAKGYQFVRVDELLEPKEIK